MSPSQHDNPCSGRWFVFEEAPKASGPQVRFSTVKPSNGGTPLKRPTSQSPGRTPVNNTSPANPTKASRRIFEWRAVIGIIVLLALLALIFPDLSTMTLYLRGDALLHLQPFSATSPSATISPHLKDAIDTAVSNALLAQVGRHDHALRVDGGKIAPEFTTSSTNPHAKNAMATHPADVILRDYMHGGRCWHMPGKQGQIGIVVPKVIRPTYVTIDHLPMKLAHEHEEEIGQAPRFVRVWAAIDGPQNEERHAEYLVEHPEITSRGAPPIPQRSKFVLLAEVEYDIYARRYSQTFAVDEYVHDLELAYGVFVFEILDNWGAEDTCVYRMRIHGKTKED